MRNFTIVANLTYFIIEIMIRLSFYRGLIAAALSAASCSAVPISQNSGKADEYSDDMAFLLSQSSTDADSNSMSSVLSTIATYSLADAKAATGVEAQSTNELANMVV